MPYYINPPPQGPIARIIASIMAALMLVVAVTLGLVAFLVVAALAALAGIAIWLRVAWIKRQMRKSGIDPNAGFRPGAQANPSADAGRVIDAEYTVVSDSREQRDE